MQYIPKSTRIKPIYDVVYTQKYTYKTQSTQN